MSNKATPSTGRQTTAVEFTVTGSLDGMTVVPPELIASAPAGDPQQLHRFTVENLGLIDVDFFVEPVGPERRGARGNRLITSLYINGPIPGNASARIAVVDAIDGSVVALETITSLAGQSLYYNRDGIYIPQGAMLLLFGLTAESGTPIKVRYHYCAVNCDKAAATIAALAAASAGPTPPPPVGGAQWTETFGVNMLEGTGANPRYLWPGSGRSIAQEDLVGLPMPVDAVIQGFSVMQQQPNTAPAAIVEYAVILNAVPVASVLVSSADGSAQLASGLGIPVSAGDRIAFSATRDQDHPTIGDVIATVLFESA